MLSVVSLFNDDDDDDEEEEVDDVDEDELLRRDSFDLNGSLALIMAKSEDTTVQLLAFIQIHNHVVVVNVPAQTTVPVLVRNQDAVCGVIHMPLDQIDCVIVN